MILEIIIRISKTRFISHCYYQAYCTMLKVTSPFLKESQSKTEKKPRQSNFGQKKRELQMQNIKR